LNLQYKGLSQVNGPLVFLENVTDVGFEEMVEIALDNGTRKKGRVVQIDGDKVAVQVFEGTNGLSLKNTKTRFLGHPMQIPLSTEVLG